MQQNYHLNARTNIHIRQQIAKSNLTNKELSARYNISEVTVSKWKNRESLKDRSSAPHLVKYSLTALQETLILSIRRSTWFALDEVCDMAQDAIQKGEIESDSTSISRSAVYRLFCRHDVNKVPEKEKEKAKKFKEYKPGFLHIDVTYLPTIEGKKLYLFVAIDRATRLIYIKVYQAKTASNAKDFLDRCLQFFPCKITHILTDNGLEFTNRLLKSKKGESCKKKAQFEAACEKNNIEHRKTKPYTPKTNGMVERVNGIIKKDTILKERYQSINEIESTMNDYMIYYNLHRRHGSLKKELNVRTPFQALEKWYELEPEIFNKNILYFKNNLLLLQRQENTTVHKQRCET